MARMTTGQVEASNAPGSDPCDDGHQRASDPEGDPKPGGEGGRDADDERRQAGGADHREHPGVEARVAVDESDCGEVAQDLEGAGEAVV